MGKGAAMSSGDTHHTHRVLIITKNDFRAEMDGGSKRTGAVVRALQDRGFEVDFVAVRPYVSSLDARPRGLFPRGVLRRLGASVAASMGTLSIATMKWWRLRAAVVVARTMSSSDVRFDVCIIEHSNLAPYRILVECPVVMDMHNVESILLSNYASSATTFPLRAAARYEARQLRRMESRFPHQFDLVTVVSANDRAELARLAARRPDDRAACVVAPNGVSDECFDFHAERGNFVVFMAHLGWRPNVDGAHWLVREVWPYVRQWAPHLQLHLVGREPDRTLLRLRTEDIRIFANVPSSMEHVGRAKVATAPLLAAGGTRLKILEALALGTPVVSTSLGALGLTHLHCDSLAIQDSPEAFARAIVTTADAPPPSSRTRSLVEGYRWRRALSPMVEGTWELAGQHHDRAVLR